MRRLTRDEIVNYVGLLNAAGNETTTRLIGWAGKVLAENPDQREQLAKNPSLIPQAIEELLRYESPSPVQARYVTRDVEHYGRPVPEGVGDGVVDRRRGTATSGTSPTPTASTFTARSITTSRSGTASTSVWAAISPRLEGRIALDEVLKRFPTWEVDWDNAEQAHTTTVRGWDKLPVFTD